MVSAGLVLNGLIFSGDSLVDTKVITSLLLFTVSESSICVNPKKV